jgi:type I restriction enzyme S subunit
MVKGWIEAKLGDIAEIRMCKRIFSEQTTPTGDIPFYKIGTFGKGADAYISRSLYEEYRDKYSFPNKGDILLSAAGTLGRTVVFDGKPAYFQDSNIVWLEIDKSQICNEYLYHCYQIMAWASPEGSTISRLYNGIIRDTEIKLPPLPEQHRIAKVLSDTDVFISVLEKLIAKKRAIKQGAMQELLTGKRRLPGFSGEWVERPFGELLKYEQPTNYIVLNTKYVDSGIPVLTAGKSLILGYTNDISGIYDNLPVIIFDDFTTESKFITYRFKVKSSAMKLLTATSACNIRLVYALMQMIDFPLKDHQRYWISEYSKLFVKIPQDANEQTAIATILSDMDAEIDALSNKLSKLRNIKQGMMSELLTGCIRLPEQNADSEDSVTSKIVKLPEQTPKTATIHINGHNRQFDDAVMIAGIVNVLYSDKYPLGRKKLQKCLYLLRRHQDESTEAFKKKAAGPYADEVRYKGG